MYLPSKRLGTDTNRTAASHCTILSVSQLARYTTIVGKPANVVSSTIVPDTATAASALWKYSTLERSRIIQTDCSVYLKQLKPGGCVQISEHAASDVMIASTNVSIHLFRNH